MPRNFIFNMGYDTSHVTSVLTREGLKDSSKVVLIAPKHRNERQENSINYIKNYLDSLDIRVSLEVFPAGVSFEQDFENSVRLFSEIENIVLSLSGGPRDFLIPLTSAAVVSPGNIQKTLFRSDIDSELTDLDLPQANLEVNTSEEELLACLKDDSKSVSELTQETELSESTVYRKIDQLEDRNLVNAQSVSGRQKYTLTLLGKISTEK